MIAGPVSSARRRAETWRRFFDDRSSRQVIRFAGLATTANVLLYLYPTIVARSVTPAEFGAFAAVFNTVALFGVVLGAFQTAVATRIAVASPPELDVLIAMLARIALIAFWGVLGVGLFSAGPVARALGIVEAQPVQAGALLAASLVPWAAALGVLQGSGRVERLGSMLLLHGALRLSTLTALLWTARTTNLLTALSASVLIGVAVVWRAMPLTRVTVRGAMLRCVAWLGRNTRSLGAMAVLAVAIGFPTLGDVALVKAQFPSHDAGIFAGISLIGRAILFLAAVINTVYYPRMAAGRSVVAIDRLLRESVRFTIGGVGALSVVVLAAPSVVVNVMLGRSYLSGHGVLIWYVVASASVALAMPPLFAALAAERYRQVATMSFAFLAVSAMLPLSAGSVLEFVRASAVVGPAMCCLSYYAWRRRPVGVTA